MNIFGKEVWGYYTSIDLEDCELTKLNNEPILKEFAIELCKVLEMNRLGDPIVMESGIGYKLYGYSMIQVIETSSVTGHFVNETRRAFIDVFSCKSYDKKKVVRFCKDFFQTEKAKVRSINRY